MREGTQDTLLTIRQNPGKYAPNKIESMDLRFEDLPDGIDLCENCRYDIKFKPAFVGDGTPLFVEFKSYSLSTWGDISNSTQFFYQFKNYIASINDMNELAYVINVGKASVDDVKLAFKSMLSNPIKKMEIFEVIWENHSFRESLFDLSSYPSYLNQNQLKEIIITDFSDLVNNTQSSLYQFIKVQ